MDLTHVMCDNNGYGEKGREETQSSLSEEGDGKFPNTIDLIDDDDDEVEEANVPDKEEDMKVLRYNCCVRYKKFHETAPDLVYLSDPEKPENYVFTICPKKSQFIIKDPLSTKKFSLSKTEIDSISETDLDGVIHIVFHYKSTQPYTHCYLCAGRKENSYGLAEQFSLVAKRIGAAKANKLPAEWVRFVKDANDGRTRNEIMTMRLPTSKQSSTSTRYANPVKPPKENETTVLQYNQQEWTSAKPDEKEKERKKKEAKQAKALANAKRLKLESNVKISEHFAKASIKKNEPVRVCSSSESSSHASSSMEEEETKKKTTTKSRHFERDEDLLNISIESHKKHQDFSDDFETFRKKERSKEEVILIEEESEKVLNTYAAEEDRRVLFVYPDDGKRDAVTMHAGDVKRLAPNQYLNDSLIDFYLKVLKAEGHFKSFRVHIFSSLFSSKLLSNNGEKEEEAVFNSVHRWAYDVEDLFALNVIIIPVVKGLHWSVLFVWLNQEEEEEDAELGSIFFMDSLNELSSHNLPAISRMVRLYLNYEKKDREVNDVLRKSRLKQMRERDERRDERKEEDEEEEEEVVVLQQRSDVKEGMHSLKLNQSDYAFTPVSLPHYQIQVPQQTDGVNCGVHMLNNIEAFFNYLEREKKAVEEEEEEEEEEVENLSLARLNQSKKGRRMVDGLKETYKLLIFNSERANDYRGRIKTMIDSIVEYNHQKTLGSKNGVIVVE